ncbi:MAG TPA: helix-turn-helix domain-containing protein [Acidobacteriota bacterium]|nr:helix-turn-helix domain-containing protein [Acidobacteriota bacterium]
MGGFQYREAGAPIGLEEAVECVWFLAAERSGQMRGQRVLPDGFLEIVFHLADPCQRFSGGRYQVQPRALLVGPMTQHATIRPMGRVDMVGIRLKPAGAAALLDVPLDKVRDRTLAAEDLKGAFPGALLERLGNEPAQEGRLKLMEQALLRACTMEKVDTRTSALCHQIRLHAGGLSVERMTQLSGLSARTLERLFKTQVGLPPKLFCRILRLQAVIRSAASHSPSSLRDAALDAGYYDQAHFLKDFKSFAGVPPGTFFGLEENRLSQALCPPMAAHKGP